MYVYCIHRLCDFKPYIAAAGGGRFVKGRASTYVHLRQPKTLYLNPNLILAPQSDPKPNPKPYPNPNHIA